jgi:hypothetical protein
VSPLDRTGLRTYRLQARKSKVKVEGFARPHVAGSTVAEFLEGLPKYLAAQDILQVASAIVEARANGRMVIMSMGAHVIKVGLSPIVMDLMREGWICALATNGAGMVHDFEIAWAGHTSEEVDEGLSHGSFGMAEETATVLNEMINTGVGLGEGLGEAVGKRLSEARAPHVENSLLACAWELKRPVTVHVAIGTDIHHLHPQASGASLGEGSYRDFMRFCERVAMLEGGVYLNVGSAVILPEVFLKAVSLARNLGHPLRRITTVNLDFIQHYRPMNNVVRRPTLLGGKGIAITGHHEIMVPLLAAAIKEKAWKEKISPMRSDTP